MHPDDNQLRAWLDGELDPRARQATSAHLAECARCTRRVSEIEDSSALARQQLDLLAPDASLRFSVHEALDQHLNRRKEPMTMKNFLRKPATITISIVILLAISLLFSPVRAMASDFLGLFRVQQVKVVSIDPATLSQLGDDMQAQDPQIRQLLEDSIVKVEGGEYTQAEDIQQAAQLAGFTPRLPANSQVKSVGVASAQKYEITIDAELWNSILAGLGQEAVTVPEEVNGEQITIAVPSAITVGIGECQSPPQANTEDVDRAQLLDCTLLVEMPSPVVQTPDGLDVPRLAEATLEILGMTPEDAQAFSQGTDWATTLVLPIPTGEGISSQEVSVDGTTATLINYEESTDYTLFWVKDGILYSIIGSGDTQNALDLSASLQ